MMLCFHFQLAKDLLHPSQEDEKRKCKLKRLVQSPNSYFMDVKCPGMYSGRFYFKVLRVLTNAYKYLQIEFAK